MTIGVFFGGKSCEHDVSVITGLQTIAAVGECIAIYIDADGCFRYVKNAESASYIKQNVDKFKKVHFRPNDRRLYCNNRVIATIDVAVLCLHGMNGEDGTIQGLLELSDIAYTGSNVLASAAGMNKPIMKRLFESADIPIVDYIVATYDQYRLSVLDIVKCVKKQLTFPLIVKPAALGSSIGINVAKTWDEFFAALRVAFEWDNTVVIENALTDFIEVNCAVIGRGEDVMTSSTEQPVGWREFLKFADKYTRSVKQSKHLIPAQIDADIEQRVRTLAEKSFVALGCSGVARVDFMIKDENVYVNEINTIPGSLSAALFANDRVAFPALIKRLIEIAKEEHAAKHRIKRSFDANIITSK